MGALVADTPFFYALPRNRDGGTSLTMMFNVLQ
jgi:hypothetical protein